MKNRIPPVRLPGALLMLLLAVPLLHAHSVWIEDTPDQQLVVRFGEPGDEFEKSPGHLDRLSLPSAWKKGDEVEPARFTVEKRFDHFLLVSAESGFPAFGETRFPLMKRGNGPASWPQFYVRWHPVGAVNPAALSPTMTLDIVPTTNAGVFRVHFRGKPLAAAKVTIRHFGTQAEEKLTAAGDGTLRYTTKAPGLVLLTTNHKESLTGFSAGVAYDVTSHNTALTWRQP